MDPMEVMRAMWRHKVFVLPVLVLTAIAAAYVYQFGPRYYEAGTSFAIVNPRLPSDRELQLDSSLANLNGDNPFLRSSDQALISEVLIARLTSSTVAEGLEAKGLSADYTVTKGINGNGFVVSITASGNSEKLAMRTADVLGDELQDNLRDIQKVNDADDRFLFTALTVTPLDKATEQFSSRLRSVIMVLLGGSILMFGAVSTARSVATVRQNKPRKQHREILREDAATALREDKRDGDDHHRPNILTSAEPPPVLPVIPMAKQAADPPPGTRRSNRIASSPRVEEAIRPAERVAR